MDLAREAAIVAVIVIGGAFSCAGIAFMSYQTLALRRAVARRVDLIVPHKARGVRRFAAHRALSPVGMRISGNIVPRWEQYEVINRLGRWGLSPDRALAAFFALRLGLALIAAATMYLMISRNGGIGSSIQQAVFILVGVFVGWYGPLSAARMMATKRLKAIESGLPDALELLVVAVEAGLALEDAIERIVAELWLTQPELAAELALTSADLKILPSRDQAFANFAERVDVPSVRSVVTTLSQTMHYGTPLAQALRAVASELRTEALYRLEERVNRLPVMMTVPMILFILPAILMVIGGPAVLRIMDALL